MLVTLHTVQISQTSVNWEFMNQISGICLFQVTIPTVSSWMSSKEEEYFITRNVTLLQIKQKTEETYSWRADFSRKKTFTAAAAAAGRELQVSMTKYVSCWLPGLWGKVFLLMNPPIHWRCVCVCACVWPDSLLQCFCVLLIQTEAHAGLMMQRIDRLESGPSSCPQRD